MKCVLVRKSASFSSAPLYPSYLMKRFSEGFVWWSPKETEARSTSLLCWVLCLMLFWGWMWYLPSWSSLWSFKIREHIQINDIQSCVLFCLFKQPLMDFPVSWIALHFPRLCYWLQELEGLEENLASKDSGKELPIEQRCCIFHSLPHTWGALLPVCIPLYP